MVRPVLVHIVVIWLISAFSIWLAAQIMRDIQISGFGDAMIAAVVIAVVNAVLGPILRFVTWPLSILTLGLFKLVVNAILLKVSSLFVPGFVVRGFLAAFLGSILITVLNEVLRSVAFRY